MIGPSGENLTFLLGLPRSGTTLLSAMLAKHPVVTCPPEPWILLALAALGETHPQHPADPQLIGDGTRGFLGDDALPAARAAATHAYNTKLAAANRTVFVDKTPRYHFILPYLRQLFPAAKFIYLKRNPLDVAASYKTSWLYDLPLLLRTDPGHRACIDLVAGLRHLADFAATTPGVLTVAYEQLTADPAPVLDQIQSHLGLEHVDRLWEFDLTGSAHARSQMGDRKILNTHRPHRGSIDTWATVFPDPDLQTLLDALSADQLRALGYGDTVDRLLARGLTDHGPDVAATYHRDVQAGLALRRASVAAAATYGDGLLPEADRATHLRDLRGNDFVALVAECHRWQHDLAAARDRQAQDRQQIQTLTAAVAELTPALEHARLRAAATDRLDQELQRRAAEDVHRAAAVRAAAIADPDPAFAAVRAAANPIEPPDLLWPRSAGADYRPHWSRPTQFINDEHRDIWEATKDLPGWQDKGDSWTLYEMAYHCGAVILEIGTFGGRSAVVELRGALRSHADRNTPPPQFYGVDLAGPAVNRSQDTLNTFPDLPKHAVFYQGTLTHFHRHVPIVPTMVFVDGDHRYEGCLADLKLLATFLAPGTPVYCHDYHGIEEVRRAVDEAVATTGAYELAGLVAGGAFLRTTARCTGTPNALSVPAFAALQSNLRQRYVGLYAEIPDIGPVVDVTAQTAVARDDLNARRDWPYRPAQHPAAYPPALPSGNLWPKISVITPAYNQGRYIEQTLLSVLNQNYPNLEHIVIDGASTDDTMAVVARYRHRLAHVVSEKDTGQSNAINKGMKLATGDILTWLNSDDMLAPGALHAVALAFHTSGADLVSGVVSVRQDGREIARHLTGCPDGPLPLKDLLDLDRRWTPGHFWYQPETFFTKSIWDRAGAHVREDLHWSMDYELWLRFAEQGANLHVVGRDLAWFRVHDQQKTNGQTVFLPELQKVRDAFQSRLNGSASAPVGSASADGTSPSPGTPGEGRGEGPSEPAPLTHSRLKIVFFNDLGNIAGAGIGHFRIARAAALAGHEVIPVAVAPYLTSTPPTTEEILAAVAAHTPDLVVLGNLHAANLDPALPGRLASKYPTIQVTHDFWSLTGRCAYPEDCTKFLTGCDDACPTKHEYPVIPADSIAAAWKQKTDAHHSDSPAILAGVSRYARSVLADRFKDAPRRPPIAAVKCAVDLTVFAPRDKRACRDLLGLPHDKFLVLFSANNLADRRKGLAHLLTALESLDLPDVLAVGLGHFDPGADHPKINFRAMGYVTDPQHLATLYAACDVFVGPSLIETFGQVFVEAAACGTPSVGYATGGVKEAIADHLSGLLAPAIDPAHLAAAIARLYHDPLLRRDTGRWGRLWAENEFSPAAGAHELFASLTALGVTDRLGVPPGIRLDPASQPSPARYLLPLPDPAEEIARQRLQLDDRERALQQHFDGELRQLRQYEQAVRDQERALRDEQQALHALVAKVPTLETDLAEVKRQREQLRTRVQEMRNTRLWRLAEATYPACQKLASTPASAFRKLFGNHRQ